MILLSFNEWELDEIIEIEESKKSTGLIRAVGAVTEIVIELGLVEFLWSVFALNHTRWWQSLVIIFICNRLALYVNYRNTHTNTHTHGHYRERERDQANPPSGETPKSESLRRGDAADPVTSCINGMMQPNNNRLMMLIFHEEKENEIENFHDECACT